MESRVNALKAQSQLIVLKVVRDTESREVRPALIVGVRWVRRVDMKRILHVSVVRSTPKALHLPHPGHLNLAPFATVEGGTLEASRCLERAVGEVELPVIA